MIFFKGIAVVDGIQTDHYQTCLSFEEGNLTYLIDVYFSRPDWSMPAAQNAPIMLILNVSNLKKYTSLNSPSSLCSVCELCVNALYHCFYVANRLVICVCCKYNIA